MKITSDVLFAIVTSDKTVKFTPQDARMWEPHFNKTFDIFGINTNVRISAFLGQVLHESRFLTKLKESLYYTTAKRLMEVWPKRFTNESYASLFVKNPTKLANKVYANRNGNGNEESGDGAKYIGRGLIGITGLANYLAVDNDLHIGLKEHPELLELPEYAALSAGSFWKQNGLNVLADQGKLIELTKRINSAKLGLDQRLRLTKIALIELDKLAIDNAVKSKNT